MLEEIVRNTDSYMDIFPKSERKKYGQFFTDIETARYMASLVETIDADTVRVLDPGCGSGILSAAIIERLIEDGVQNIFLSVYEIDLNIYEILQSNLLIMSDYCRTQGVSLAISIIKENFILANEPTWRSDCAGIYDIIISNPPYKKIGKDTDESRMMSSIIHGQPNLYALFMAMSAALLRTGGQMVFITPRSWTSGSYFRKFREYLLTNCSVDVLHLFEARDKVFSKEKVLQETMILKGTKTQCQRTEIQINTCQSMKEYNNIHTMRVAANLCIQAGDNRYVMIPTDQNDLEVLDFTRDLPADVSSLGYEFKTGKVVEFRNRERLRYSNGANTIPLVQACNLSSGKVQFGVETDKAQYFYSDHETENVVTHNTNTVFLKRFSSKEEQRRLQPAINLAADHPHITCFATENHVNYLVKKNSEISPCEAYGIFTILSSEIWDRYYRILNGSTQVNATEINSMPFPDTDTIQRIGRRVMRLIRENQQYNCDTVLRELIG